MAAIGWWIRLCLPSFGLGFESHAHYLSFNIVKFCSIFVIVLRKGRKYQNVSGFGPYFIQSSKKFVCLNCAVDFCHFKLQKFNESCGNQSIYKKNRFPQNMKIHYTPRSLHVITNDFKQINLYRIVVRKRNCKQTLTSFFSDKSLLSHWEISIINPAHINTTLKTLLL